MEFVKCQAEYNDPIINFKSQKAKEKLWENHFA
jgi:hypothetical protein